MGLGLYSRHSGFPEHPVPLVCLSMTSAVFVMSGSNCEAEPWLTAIQVSRISSVCRSWRPDPTPCRMLALQNKHKTCWEERPDKKKKMEEDICSYLCCAGKCVGTRQRPVFASIALSWDFFFFFQNQWEHVPRSHLRHRAGNAGHDDLPTRRHLQRWTHHEERSGRLSEVRRFSTPSAHLLIWLHVKTSHPFYVQRCCLSWNHQGSFTFMAFLWLWKQFDCVCMNEWHIWRWH